MQETKCVFVQCNQDVVANNDMTLLANAEDREIKWRERHWGSLLKTSKRNYPTCHQLANIFWPVHILVSLLISCRKPWTTFSISSGGRAQTVTQTTIVENNLALGNVCRAVRQRVRVVFIQSHHSKRFGLWCSCLLLTQLPVISIWYAQFCLQCYKKDQNLKNWLIENPTPCNS